MEVKEGRLGSGGVRRGGIELVRGCVGAARARRAGLGGWCREAGVDKRK